MIESIFMWLVDFIILLVESVLIASFIVGNIGFISGLVGKSMEPNFFHGNAILVNRIFYREKDIKKGDVVVLDLNKKKNNILYNTYREMVNMKNGLLYRLKIGKSSSIQNNLLKRVVAQEGDIIDFDGGKLILNGEVQEEDYVKGETLVGFNLVYPLEIPKGKVFVLGDNRENSYDSRRIGLIDMNQIKGKVFYQLNINKLRRK